MALIKTKELISIFCLVYVALIELPLLTYSTSQTYDNLLKHISAPVIFIIWKSFTEISFSDTFSKH